MANASTAFRALAVRAKIRSPSCASMCDGSKAQRKRKAKASQGLEDLVVKGFGFSRVFAWFFGFS